MLVKDRAEEAGVSSGAFRLYHGLSPMKGEREAGGITREKSEKKSKPG